MTTKEKLLAAQLLGRAADEFGKRGCNDWEFPSDWTATERVEFVSAYHGWNGDPDEFNPRHLYLPDFAVMKFLAEKLREETLKPT